MKYLLVTLTTMLALVGCGGGSGDTPEEPSSLSINSMGAPICSDELPDNPSLVNGYYQIGVCQWPVRMNAALFNDDKAQAVFDAIKFDLEVVQDRLPERMVSDLRSVNIWLELDIPEFSGGVYHPSMQWLEENGYPVEWAQGVQLGNANNYLTWTQQQPAIVLHELAHAYDDQHFNNAQPELLEAFESAKQSGIYSSVAYLESNGVMLEAYALTNSNEYFAELTEAYFWVNDFYPFNRADLQSHDVAGFNAIKSMWEP